MLVLRKEAEDDINVVYDWYEVSRRGLGVEFVSEVEDVFKRIRRASEGICSCV